ncbi:prephenate/arogenate dehydrogenase family protein [Bartonella sp. B41]
MSRIHFEKIALIGIGLIGSSLARVIKKENLASYINISSRSKETLKRARELELGNFYTTDNAKAVEGADLIIIAVPVGSSAEVAKNICNHLKPGAIVSDVGSTKELMIAEMTPLLPKSIHFIPGHPIAGTEYSGPDAGFPDLFMNRWCILTPFAENDASAVAKLTSFWEACGACVEIMDPKHHDLVLAVVSHLPHLIAYNIVGTASDLEKVTNSEVIAYSASGFRDFTRLASSDPVMWRDICLHNKDAILEMLSRFNKGLAFLERAIQQKNGEELLNFFTRMRAIRHSIIAAGQEIDAPDFGRHAVVKENVKKK